MVISVAKQFWHTLSGLGLLLGALCFAGSLTPSLIPRTYVLQGVLGGTAFASGYGCGVLLLWAWDYLELPKAPRPARHLATWVSSFVAAGIVLAFLSAAAEWQNSIRDRMSMEPVDSAHPAELAIIALLVAGVLIVAGRLAVIFVMFMSERPARLVQRRVSRIVGAAMALLLIALFANGVLLRAGLRAADSSAQALDALIEPGIARPANPMQTGSATSLMAWEDLGRTGREFVSGGPTAGEISSFSGNTALEPIRVYAGLNNAESPQERAFLALEELKRVEAFDRSVLVIVVPTGTGWIDPAAMDTLEYLHRGDVASVAVQYSYLSSWISILVEPGYSAGTGKALFDEVYRHWRSLPSDARPKLYLHGLSLGASGSEQSFGLIEVLGDPFDGALWAGPPFSTPMWAEVTADRDPASPEWLPRYGDGSLIRFTNQKNHLKIPGAQWDPVRIVYLQYASDPIVRFEPESLFRRPEWMNTPRGPDVSPELRWYPVVTFLQLLLDMAIALHVPIGYGHLYAHAHYIDAWMEVTAPVGWSDGDIVRLKEKFRLQPPAPEE